MTDNATKKYIVAGIFGLIVIVCGIYLAMNYEKLFTNKVEITYPDRCVEIFINNELTTPECTEGRKIAEEQRADAEWNPGFNLTYQT